MVIKDVLPFADKSNSWYKDFVTNPIWKDLKGCQQSGAPYGVYSLPCGGFLLLQWTASYLFCDNVSYNCADRSDEGDCGGIKDKKKLSWVSFSVKKSITFPC